MLINPFSNNKIPLGVTNFNVKGPLTPVVPSGWDVAPLGCFSLNTLDTDDIAAIASGGYGAIAKILLGDGLLNYCFNGFLIKKQPIVFDGTEMYLFQDANGTYRAASKQFTHEELQEAKYQYKFFVWPMIDATTLFNTFKRFNTSFLEWPKLFVKSASDGVAVGILTGLDLVGFIADTWSQNLVQTLRQSWVRVDDYSAFEAHDYVGYSTAVVEDHIDLLKNVGQFLFSTFIDQQTLEDAMQTKVWLGKTVAEGVTINNIDDITKRLVSLNKESVDLKEAIEAIDTSDWSATDKINLSKLAQLTDSLTDFTYTTDLSKSASDEFSSLVVSLDKPGGLTGETVNLAKDISKNTVDLNKSARKLKVDLDKPAIDKIKKSGSDLLKKLSFSFNTKKFFDNEATDQLLRLELYIEIQDAILRYFIPQDYEKPAYYSNRYTYCCKDIISQVRSLIDIPSATDVGYSEEVANKFAYIPGWEPGYNTVINLNKCSVIAQEEPGDDGQIHWYIDPSVFFAEGTDAVYDCIKPFEFYFISDGTGNANLVFVGVEYAGNN
ncbi:MAG: hypothetical protein HDR03_15005 [Lachnospiraceae bacterium]|nr:hypothetical protein [Lachnospiraceae bacterium]